MPEPSLNGPRVMPLVGQSVAAGVALHVWMRLELQAGTCCRALDHPRQAGRTAIPAHSQIRTVTTALPLEPLAAARARRGQLLWARAILSATE
jgi:hypothetical protein